MRMFAYLRFAGWCCCIAASAAGLSPIPASASYAPYNFQVQISLSQKAATRLRKPSEGITISARYYGDPLQSKEKYADEVGQIPLGTELVQIPGKEGSIEIRGEKIQRKRLAWIQGPVFVNVNVFSARHSGPNNILACDFFDGKLSDARAHPIAIHCSLIEENAPTSQKF